MKMEIPQLMTSIQWWESEILQIETTQLQNQSFEGLEE